MKQSLKDFLVTAKKKGVPFLSITTVDQMATLQYILNTIWDANSAGAFCPGPSPQPLDLQLMSWSRGNGLGTYTRDGAGWRVSWVDMEPGPFLRGLGSLPANSVIVVINGHWLLEDRDAVDVLMCLRDRYESDGRTLIMLGPSFNFPPEIRRDFISFNEPLPDKNERIEIVRTLCESNEVKMDGAAYERAASLLGGLSRFTVRQAAAMALKKSGIDHDILWERKKSFIKQVRGVSISTDPYTFKDVRGVRNVIEFLTGLAKSLPIAKIVHLDELDKDSDRFSDRSGAGAHQHKKLLTLLDPNRGVKAVMLNGMPGTGKTMIARAMGPTFGIPTFSFNMGDAMGEGLLGQAEREMDEAIETLETAVDGLMLVLATTNRIARLSAELRDRFSPTFFFDYPDQEEKAGIWEANIARYGLPDQPRPSDVGWSGRNIMHCCMLAKESGMTLIDAARYIVPGAQANAAEISEYRQIALNCFISASYPGPYEGPRPGSSGRRVVT